MKFREVKPEDVNPKRNEAEEYEPLAEAFDALAIGGILEVSMPVDDRGSLDNFRSKVRQAMKTRFPRRKVNIRTHKTKRVIYLSWSPKGKAGRMAVAGHGGI